jgi:hypothetical protein
MRRVVVLLCLLPWLAHAENITSATCTPAVTTGCFTRNTVGFSSVFVGVSGTWTGSLVFEVAGNAAGPWHSSRAYTPDGDGAYAVVVTANGSWSVPTFGAPLLRVRASALSSGSATVTAQASSFQIPTDFVRAIGATNGPVDVSGTVTSNPSQTFLDALAPACTYPEGPPVVAMSITPVTVDDPTITNRSEMTIVNEGTTNNVWCCRGAACTPTTSARYIIFPKVALTFEGLRDSDVIRCRSSAGSPDVSVVEVSCGQ